MEITIVYSFLGTNMPLYEYSTVIDSSHVSLDIGQSEFVQTLSVWLFTDGNVIFRQTSWDILPCDI